jgi:hypothetical protein
MPNTGGFRPWTEENVTTYVARHPIGTQACLAMQLMLCLSVRKSDAVQIGPRHIHKTREHPLGVLDNYQPQKGRRTGGNYVTVPLHEDLAAAIAATPVIGSDTYLVTSFGKPFTANGFGNKMQRGRAAGMRQPWLAQTLLNAACGSSPQHCPQNSGRPFRHG